MKGTRVKAKDNVILLKPNKRRPNQQKPASKKRFFIYALGLLLLGGSGYLLYTKLKKKQSPNQLPEDNDTVIINNNLPAYTTTSSSKQSQTSSKSNDKFPLKIGSKGDRVTILQQALARLIGEREMNANGGIDGKFGKGTTKALRAAGYAEVIDEKTYNTIVNSVGSELKVVFNPQAIAQELYNAARLQDAGTVISVLQKIKTTQEYSTVNEIYKRLALSFKNVITDVLNFSREESKLKTIVTDLLDFAFKDNADARVLLIKEFKRIGLKVDDAGIWSLQGFKLYKDIITVRKTVVTDQSRNKIPVKRNTILGDELKIENGLTWFRTVDNNILCVPTQDVKYT